MKEGKRLAAMALSLVIGGLGLAEPSLAYGARPELEQGLEEFKVQAQLIKKEEDGLNLEIRLPKLEGLDEPTFQKDMNEKISQDIRQDLEEFKKNSFKEADYIVDFKTSSYKNLISIELMTYSIGRGQANGENKRRFYNIDRERNRQIELSDLLEGKYDSFLKGALAKEDLLIDQEELKGLDLEKNFKIDSDGGLVLGFDQGELKARSQGFLDLKLSREKLSAYLKKPVRLERAKLKPKRKDLDVRIEYPVIVGMKDKKFQDRQNEIIKNNLERALEDFEKEAPAKSVYMVDFTIRGHGDLLSIELLDYKIMYGDANGESIKTIYNIDLKEAKVLGLGDLFPYGSDYRAQLSKDVEELIRRDKDNFFQEQFRGIDEKDNFYIDGLGNLVITFQEGLIAPYSQGNPEFKISRQRMEEISRRFMAVEDKYRSQAYGFTIKLPKAWQDRLVLEEEPGQGLFRLNFYFRPSNPDLEEAQLFSILVRDKEDFIDKDREIVLLGHKFNYSLEMSEKLPYEKGSQERKEFEECRKVLDGIDDIFKADR